VAPAAAVVVIVIAVLTALLGKHGVKFLDRYVPVADDESW
jgi:hypothetical protein